MDKPIETPSRFELYCLSVLIGQCAGIIYVIGTTVLKVLNLW